MHRMVDTIRRIARHEMAQQNVAALAVVKSVHNRGAGNEYSCTVVLRETGIVLPKVPIATHLIGLASLPREADLVVVLFVGGDLHAPVVVGRLYNEVVAPPEHEPGEYVTSLPGDETDAKKNLQLRVKTPGDGTRRVSLVLDGDVKVEIEISDEGVRVQAKEAKLTVTQKGSSDGKIELEVGKSKVTVEQGGNVTVEAEKKLTLKGSEVEISGETSVKVAGQTIDLN